VLALLPFLQRHLKMMGRQRQGIQHWMPRVERMIQLPHQDIIFVMNTLGILKFVNGAHFISAEKPMLEELVKKHPIEPKVNCIGRRI
jgi:hypothetical protein